ncbi:MAG: hypothetical protein JWO03_517 [Bacteroidetes bacterium]|nr:hypothetical protein [Bacteroidota bacterium]
MKNEQPIFIALFSVLILLASCSKTSVTDAPPVLAITSPSAAQNFAAGSSVHITGTATASGTDDAHLLHELSITVTRASDHMQVWIADISVHEEQSHMIDTSFALPHPSVRDSLVLEAVVVNHLLNKATQKIGFIVNP